MGNLNESPDASIKPADHAEFEALSTVIRALQGLGVDARQRVLAAVATFLGIGSNNGTMPTASTAPRAHAHQQAAFGEDRAPSPKEFLLEKRPQTDVERVTCLAYYLTHFRETPHFKTLDLGKVNTEAAQQKFANAAAAVDNAAKAGFLAQASKGNKQLSAIGELYVQALPDRAAAKDAVAHSRPKKKRPRRGTRTTDGNPTESIRPESSE